MISLWKKPNYREADSAIRASSRGGLILNLQIEAFRRSDERLDHTIHLPPLTEKKLRRLLGAKPREVILGSWPLASRQLKAFQRLIELRFQRSKFDYFFDGDGVLGQKESLKSIKYWRTLDASLRTALRRGAQPGPQSRAALDETYQRLREQITRAYGAVSWLNTDKK